MLGAASSGCPAAAPRRQLRAARVTTCMQPPSLCTQAATQPERARNRAALRPPRQAAAEAIASAEGQGNAAAAGQVRRAAAAACCPLLACARQLLALPAQRCQPAPALPLIQSLFCLTTCLLPSHTLPPNTHTFLNRQALAQSAGQGGGSASAAAQAVAEAASKGASSARLLCQIWQQV